MSENEEFKIVEELRPGLRGINVKVKCDSKNEEKQVTSKKTGENLRVTEAIVGDETASILLTLWNDDIDKMEKDHIYQLKNVYTTVFKGSLRLNIGKYGSMEEINEDTLKEVNTGNNLSDKVYEQEQKYRPRSSGQRFSSGGYGGGGGGGYGGGNDRRRSFRGGSGGDKKGFSGKRRY